MERQDERTQQRQLTHIVVNAETSAVIVRTEVMELEHMQAVVGGYIEAVHQELDDHATVWCHEEGKLRQHCVVNQRVTDVVRPWLLAGDFVAGDVLVTGYDPATGDTTSLTDEQVKRWTDVLGSVRVQGLVMRPGLG